MSSRVVSYDQASALHLKGRRSVTRFDMTESCLIPSRSVFLICRCHPVPFRPVSDVKVPADYRLVKRMVGQNLLQTKPVKTKPVEDPIVLALYLSLTLSLSLSLSLASMTQTGFDLTKNTIENRN